MKIETTAQQEIYENAKDRIWDISAVHALNCEKIKVWLFKNAQEKLHGITSADKEAVKNKKAIAIKGYDSLSDTLEGLYHLDKMPVNTKLMDEAEDGTLKAKTPTGSTIWAWFFAFIMAAAFEFTVFGWLVFFRGAGWMLLGLALILFLGGFSTGGGVGDIMIGRKKSEEGEHKYRIEGSTILKIGGGLFAIVGVVAIRAVYADFLAAAIAVLFGSAVTMAEMFWHYYKVMRKYYLDRMFYAQKYYAATRLDHELGEKGNSIDDTWRIHYEQYIAEISQKLEKATSERKISNPELDIGLRQPELSAERE